MAITRHNLKKWYNMLRGKSLYHVRQDEGTNYSFDSVKGYFNDLTEKVTMDKDRYSGIEVIKCYYPPKYDEYYFPIAIFQYGLGAYDLYLRGVDADLMKQKFLCQAEWALNNQNDDGSWNTFQRQYPNAPFSSMGQGEGCSLLVRAYVETNDPRYLRAAQKAIDFMLLQIDQGGTSVISGEDIYLFEYTFAPFVFNGWMFSIFGLMDFVILTRQPYYQNVLDRTIATLAKNLEKMDNGYWSMYRNDKTIASPFYHKLHIAQLSVLYKYTKDELFLKYKEKFIRYNRKVSCKVRAFFKKAWQKVFEK